MEQNDDFKTRVQRFYNSLDSDMQKDFAAICPELKESEDERIRKAIIEHYRGMHSATFPLRGLSREEYIAYLEKQGSQDLANSAQTCKVEPKSADKVEATQIQIEKGKWYVCDTPRYTDFAVGKAYYCPQNGMLKPNENEMARYVAKHCFHPWTIEDAKDGDVLYTPKGLGVEGIFLIGGWIQVDVTGRTLYSIIGYRVEDDEIITGGIGAIWWEGVVDPFFPATKEQRDLLFQKMKEAGYEWDAENKELKKVEQKSSIEICPHSINSKSYLETGHTVEQKPAWSEEDEENLNWFEKFFRAESVVAEGKDIPQDRYLWFKNLKERVQPQPKSDWNNNDEICFNRLMAICADERIRRNSVFSEIEIKDLMDWLESIKKRVQPQWKPSDEQMRALKGVASYNKNDTLESLYNDLKKL